MNIKYGVSAIALVCLLSACGGGGSSGDDASNAAIGGWTGTTTDGENIATIVLDDGTVWGMVSDGGSAFAVFHAPSSRTSGASFSATSPRIYQFGTDAYIAGTLTGTVNASSFGGSATGQGGSVGFNMSSVPEYKTQATLNQVSGTWNGSFGDLGGVENISNATISGAGEIAVTVSGCNISGNLTPRSGVAAYNVTLRYRTTAGCLANVDVTGVATLDGPDGQLFIGIINADRSNAGLAILSRQPV